MIRKHPHLSLGGCGMLLILVPAIVLANVCLLSQYGWFSLPPDLLFAAVMAQLSLMGIGLCLVSLAILWSVRRW